MTDAVGAEPRRAVEEQLRVFHTVEGIGSQDMANQADFILTSMYGFVSARHDWAHPEEEGKSYFSGFYESLAGATLRASRCRSRFMDPSTEGYETSSRKAAKMWTLETARENDACSQGRALHERAGGRGEEEDMARTCIGASQKRGGGARGGGVTGFVRKLHESGANLHRRRVRVDDLCGQKLEKQIECFRHVYDRIRCLVPNCAHLPMIPPPILLQQPPSFFVPANAAFRIEESSGEDEDDYARQIAEGKIAHKAKKAAMGIGDKEKQGAAARETVVIQKREKAPVRNAMKAKEAAAAAKEARNEREADNAWREEADDDEEEGAKIDKSTFDLWAALGAARARPRPGHRAGGAASVSAARRDGGGGQGGGRVARRADAST